jgi:4-hydroxybenzoate polyprenyltransferase
MQCIPHRGYFLRMNLYLKEMYPVHSRFVISTMYVLSFFYLLQRIYNMNSPFLSVYSLLGILGIFLLLLILRLMDELKDKAIDRELFSERPLPSGRVEETDIVLSLWLTVITFLGINILVIKNFWLALIVLGYTFLMFRYFFMASILRKNLILNLLTHNPVVPIMLVYIYGLFIAEHDLSFINSGWFPVSLLILMFWSMSLAWEITRKIRSQEEENAYVTYSQIFGRKGAVVIATGIQSITLLIAIYFYFRLILTPVFLLVITAGYGLLLCAYFRFILHPHPLTAGLKPWAEYYLVAVCLAACLDRAAMIAERL